MKRRQKTVRYLLLVGTVLLGAVFCQPARADESYFMIVYAAQRTPNVPRFTHTFATFVKVTGEGADTAKYKVEEHTISWIAKTLDIVVARARPEPGVNLTLADSRKLAATLDEQVTMWGPFEIKKELYDRALKQIERLESGKVQYKAVDGRFRPEASNCIHAVSDIDVDDGALQAGTAFGNEASQLVAEHLRRWIIQPEKTHAWISERLGLDKDSIAHGTNEDKPRPDGNTGRTK
jgi:hypothetical protein